MSYKKIIPVIFLKDEKCYTTYQCNQLITEDSSVCAVDIAESYQNKGADEIMIIDLSYDDASHDKAISIIREISKRVDIPLLVGGNVNRVEDVKKYLYAGARMALLDNDRESNMLMLKEVADRFGKEKIGMIVNKEDADSINLAKDNKIAAFVALREEIVFSGKNNDMEWIQSISDASDDSIQKEYVTAVTGPGVSGYGFELMGLKDTYASKGITVNRFESSIPFSEFKLNPDGLIPVVVQDYKTDEVLMVAYMNEEAFCQTVKTGIMTYYSRSRQELWVKGLTSGHFQYVMSLDIDCDNDTLLAKVKQIGAACHTGNRSCFYRNLVKKDIPETNPLKILNDVMNVILDRKIHPKEGSYTNYLFDKGIDKILKKCGEEATEIVIAAKNPDPEEIKYEISDFLYHVMVLMAVKDVTWDDIMKELANR
ncbi:MAG: bifunctional phosphoribosyl-AMP cyclohydrolase/phosphoribosyl-ATP diphosphatase HisIE [Thermoflexaceae bacterium]|nr:bifunctional phosphoribosyl-AMP cyclohydrolase/phosphoribosyl-ATP diphosphatase HisIE [Thermoflexaceae bacterium]